MLFVVVHNKYIYLNCATNVRYSMQKIRDITITIVQPNLIWEEVNTNLRNLEKLINSITETDLIILPEMFNTSFSLKTTLAEKMEGKSVNWLKKIALKKNTAICGSLSIKDGVDYYNRLIWITQTGKLFYYDKKHLFSLSKEDNCFSPGEKRLVVVLNGWKICPFICYDLRFPAWCRYKGDYDCLIFIASWPAKRINAWQNLIKARAIENMSYVIGVNRVGLDGNMVSFNGRSCLIDPLGKDCFTANEQVLVKNISLSRYNLQKSRELYGFLNDRDNFQFIS